MANVDSDSDEAMTREEIRGDAPAVQNAFTELMAPKPKPAPAAASVARMSRPSPFKDRMGLGAYLDDPASLSPAVVVSHSDAFVAVRDKYPKATVHTLLLPRSPRHSLQHPFDALADPAFLAAVRAEADALQALVAAELRRR
ncbi:Aprataxin-like protein, partial [Tolypocladium paradoxum]